MNHRWRFTLKLWTFLLLTAAAVSAQQRLVLIGGGDRPEAALARFVEWAGGKEKARILIVTWASAEPAASFESLKQDFDRFSAQTLDHAPAAPLDADRRARLLEQLKTATGVFFSGGDQNRIMDVLKDEELYRTFRERYAAGVVFGGTSAGTALMSSPMMTGENDLTVIDGAKVGTRTGLGLLPDAIVDQHFIVRQRENRLLGLVLQSPRMLGVGIDEDTALLVKDNRTAEVAGATYVMMIDARDPKTTFRINLLRPGQKYDLVKRKVISK